DRAEDATQEALVRAWRELPRLRDPSRFQAWLRRLLVNACYDEGRRIRRRSEVVLLSDHHPAIADESSGVIDRDRLDRAFRRLPGPFAGVALDHTSSMVGAQFRSGADRRLRVPSGSPWWSPCWG